MTERLDRIEASIESINQTLATLASDFLRPALQQSVENREATEATNDRLDRVSEVLAATTIKQDTNTDAITQLTRKIDANADAVAASNRNFEILLNESRADRQTIKAMQENIQSLFVELHSTNQRVDTLEQAS